MRWLPRNWGSGASVLLALGAVALIVAALWVGLRSRPSPGSSRRPAAPTPQESTRLQPASPETRARPGALEQLLAAPLALTPGAAPTPSEASLARCLSSLPWVEHAEVLLRNSGPPAFGVTATPPSALIILRLAVGASPSAEHLAGVADIATSAVPGLDTAHLTIRDQDARLLYDRGRAIAPPPVAASTPVLPPHSASWPAPVLLALAAVLLCAALLRLLRSRPRSVLPAPEQPPTPLGALADLPPSALAAALRREPPAVRARLLAGLPGSLREAVLAAWPEAEAALPAEFLSLVPTPAVLEAAVRALRESAISST